MEKNQKPIWVKKNGGNFFNVDFLRNYFKPILCSNSQRVIYVFSAMAGVTRLLESIFQAGKSEGNIRELNSLLTKFEDMHLLFISELFGKIDRDVPYVEKLFDELRRIVLQKTDFVNEDHRRASILQFGELVSCGIVSDYLNSININHKLLDARDHIVTSDNHKDAEIIEVKGLKEVLENQECEIFIIQGFIGRNSKGEETVLSLNGSDLTAAEVGIAVHTLGYHVPEVIYGKDVNGVYDSDPKLREKATLLLLITLEDYLIILLKNNHSYPVFPLAVIALVKAGLSVRVKSYINLDNPGTLVRPCRL